MDSEQMTLIDNASPEELELMLAQPENEAQPEATPEQKPDTVVVDPAKQFKELEERMAKYEKQLKDKESFINQRNQEIGLLRKQLLDRQTEILAEDVEPSEEEIMRDPKAAVKKAIEKAELRKQVEAQRQAEVTNEIQTQNQQILEKLVPTFEDDKATILEVMKADGLPAEMVSQFEANPLTLHPSIVFQLSKRAEMFRKIQELEGKLKSEPKKTADNLVKYGQAKSPTSQAPATKTKSNKLDALSEADIDKLSLDELRELQKEL